LSFARTSIADVAAAHVDALDTLIRTCGYVAP
jgi:hypothetical protein